MKKIIAILLSLALLLGCAAGLAEEAEKQNFGTIRINGVFTLKGILPEGYKVIPFELDDDAILTRIIAEDPAKPEMMLSIAFDESYSDVERLNDLDDDQMAILEKTFTDTDPYGRLVTAGAPVYNKDHRVVGYAMVDISMDVIRSQMAGFVRTLSLVLAGLTIVISFIAIWVVNRSIIRPINMLSHAASNYSAGRENLREIDSMDIRTRDEIESLYRSIRQMLHDISKYIDNLVAAGRELSLTRNKADEMSELAHTDALTGVKSKLAYDQKKEELSAGDNRYGIVMADLNDLKKINDTEGHEKGDEAICKVCSILCSTFSHSPVYRIGGDEFVVIVTGRDYDQIDELTEGFKRNVEQKGGGITAAIGYALHEGDESVEDVFRRADSTMYAIKKQMKRKDKALDS